MALRKELKQQGDFLFKNRSYLPVIILLIGLYLYATNASTLTIIAEDQRRTFELVCFLVCLAGLFIRVVSIGFTADNTSGRNTSVGQLADTINQTGPYSVMRHPLYLGNFFMWLGLAAFTQNTWFVIAFVLFYTLYYERIMYAEEEFLIGKYGDDYLRYSEKTPAFIPKFSRWKKPSLSFSWTKIMRQEKAGIVNLFLVIILFRATREYAAEGNFSQVEEYWLYAFIASVVWYIIVKVLQKTTRILKNDR
ncbi:MAG: methyltransferase family protein [Bacteroidales bacterium]